MATTWTYQNSCFKTWDLKMLPDSQTLDPFLWWVLLKAGKYLQRSGTNISQYRFLDTTVNRYFCTILNQLMFHKSRLLVLNDFLINKEYINLKASITTDPHRLQVVTTTSTCPFLRPQNNLIPLSSQLPSHLISWWRRSWATPRNTRTSLDRWISSSARPRLHRCKAGRVRTRSLPPLPWRERRISAAWCRMRVSGPRLRGGLLVIGRWVNSLRLWTNCSLPKSCPMNHNRPPFYLS